MIAELQELIDQVFDADNEDLSRRLINRLPPANMDEVEHDVLIHSLLGAPFLFVPEEVFNVEGRGGVCRGTVLLGTVSINDEVTVINYNGSIIKTKVSAVEMFKKLLDGAEAGDKCGLLFESLSGHELSDAHIIVKTADHMHLLSRNPIIADYVDDDELEYLKEYREMSAEGPISERDRRYLEKIKESNGISDERAAELEAMV